jgi:hypothetical protein
VTWEKVGMICTIILCIAFAFVLVLYGDEPACTYRSEPAEKSQ